MGSRVVEKLQHERVPVEDLLDDPALHASSATVNEPHFTQSYSVSLVEVLFHDRRNIARWEGVKIELAFDGDAQRVLILHFPP
jgi:hypothetical protein